MFNKKYRYHLVYSYEKDSHRGLGSCTIHYNSKIKNDLNINEIKKFIELEDGFDNIIILNWIRLK